MADEVLRVFDVHKSFSHPSGTICVLEGVSFSLNLGEMVAVMGSSGSGKTTLLHLVGALDRPDRGEILVHGTNIAHFSVSEQVLYRRQKVGFVFQQFHLIPNLTAWENVALPLHYQGVPLAEARERAFTLLETVGLAERGEHYPALLSGGEKQRVALCRAVIHRPQILLADEPTGSLDRQNAVHVLELLQGLLREHPMAILLVTHSAEVAATAQRILYLKDGRFVSPDREETT